MSDKKKAVSIESSISSFKANRPSTVVISVNKEMTKTMVNNVVEATQKYVDKGCKPCGFNGYDIVIRHTNPVREYYSDINEVVDVSLV